MQPSKIEAIQANVVAFTRPTAAVAARPRTPWPDRLLPALLFVTLVLPVLVYKSAAHLSATAGDIQATARIVDTFTAPKGACAGAAALALAVLMMVALRATSALPRLSPLLGTLLLAQLALFTVSVACAPSAGDAAWGLRGHLYMLVVFVVVAGSSRGPQTAMVALVAAAVVVAAIVIAESAGWYLPGLPAALTASLLRPTATLNHRNVAAALLAAATPALLTLAMTRRQRASFAAVAVATAVVVAALYETSSRAAMLAALVAVAFATARQRWVTRRPLRLLAVAGAVVVVSTLALAMPPHLPTAASGTDAIAAPPLVRDRLFDKVERVVEHRDNSARERLQLWRTSLSLIAARPLTGGGPDAFAQAWRAAHPQSPLPHAHDLWLQAGVAFGVPTMLLFALAALAAARVAWTRAATGTPIESAAAAAVVAFLVVGVFECVDLMMGVNLHFAAALGALVPCAAAARIGGER